MKRKNKVFVLQIKKSQIFRPSVRPTAVQNIIRYVKLYISSLKVNIYSLQHLKLELCLSLKFIIFVL